MTASDTHPAAVPAGDPVWDFLQALPAHIRQRLNRTETLFRLIHAAARHGWTTKQLVAETTRNHSNAVNQAGVIMYRLEQCAEHPPTTPTGARLLPFCTPDCRDRSGWLEDENGHAVGRCPCRTPAEETA